MYEGQWTKDAGRLLAMLMAELCHHQWKSTTRLVGTLTTPAHKRSSHE
jgi:hypothetical protein